MPGDEHPYELRVRDWLDFRFTRMPPEWRYQGLDTDDGHHHAWLEPERSLLYEQIRQTLLCCYEPFGPAEEIPVNSIATSLMNLQPEPGMTPAQRRRLRYAPRPRANPAGYPGSQQPMRDYSLCIGIRADQDHEDAKQLRVVLPHLNVATQPEKNRREGFIEARDTTRGRRVYVTHSLSNHRLWPHRRGGTPHLLQRKRGAVEALDGDRYPDLNVKRIRILLNGSEIRPRMRLWRPCDRRPYTEPRDVYLWYLGGVPYDCTTVLQWAHAMRSVLHRFYQEFWYRWICPHLDYHVEPSNWPGRPRLYPTIEFPDMRQIDHYTTVHSNKLNRPEMLFCHCYGRSPLSPPHLTTESALCCALQLRMCMKHSPPQVFIRRWIHYLNQLDIVRSGFARDGWDRLLLPGPVTTVLGGHIIPIGRRTFASLVPPPAVGVHSHPLFSCAYEIQTGVGVTIVRRMVSPRSVPYLPFIAPQQNRSASTPWGCSLTRRRRWRRRRQRRPVDPLLCRLRRGVIGCTNPVSSAGPETSVATLWQHPVINPESPSREGFLRRRSIIAVLLRVAHPVLHTVVLLTVHFFSTIVFTMCFAVFPRESLHRHAIQIKSDALLGPQMRVSGRVEGRWVRERE